MRRRQSSLNPYAAPFVPLPIREAGGGTPVRGGGSNSPVRGGGSNSPVRGGSNSNNYGGTVWYQTPQHTTQDRQYVDTRYQTPQHTTHDLQYVDTRYRTPQHTTQDRQYVDTRYQTPQHTTQDRQYVDTRYQTPQHTTRDQQYVDTSARRLSPVESNPASSYYISPSQSATQLADMQSIDEDREIDLEYLRMTFPGISEQSLLDVYTFSNGDIDAAVDMLSQLEFDDAVRPQGNLLYDAVQHRASIPDDAVRPHGNLLYDAVQHHASLPDDAVEPRVILPDTLDIGDVSDSPPKQNVLSGASSSSGHLGSSKSKFL